MTEIEKAPALGISVQCPAGIVFQTYLPQDADAKTINEMLDKLVTAGARQQAKVDLVEMRKNLKVNEDQLVRMREDRARVEADLAAPQQGRRNENRNTAQLDQNRKQADANEKRMGEIIVDIRQSIADTEKLIAGD